MVNPKKVHGLLQNLQTALERLNKIAQLRRDVFLADPVSIGAAKYYLQTAIEACIDIGNHIIASEGFRGPKDYRDVFNVLEENAVLPKKVGVQLRQMAGLRNRLVHLYWEVDDELIYGYIQANLGDFDEYARYIMKYVQTE